MRDDLFLPTEIPWSEIKGPDLEELLYWLFDALGAKEMEWRIGGKGAGAADQGRDIELAFYVPSPDGSIVKQKWWVEAKGRSDTVSSADVQAAVHNAAGISDVDVLVIATNSNFSNPTRDWVKEWQSSHPRPVIKLWERTELESMCSKNPLAVVRLFGSSLSPQGRVEVVSARFWDYLNYSDDPSLTAIWSTRADIKLDEYALFALIASEFANGNIERRPWSAVVDRAEIPSTLGTALVNYISLAFRADDRGVREEPMIRAITYLTLAMCRMYGPSRASEVLMNVWDKVEEVNFPQPVRRAVLEPVMFMLQAEIKDLCVDNCRRVSSNLELLTESELKSYWQRFSVGSVPEKDEPRRILTIEQTDHPCDVGFDVTGDAGCPLCRIKKPADDVAGFMDVVARVVGYRAGEPRD